MKAAIIALISGVLFSIGLVVSGMTNPSIVIGFLDIFGEWNYSLAFVMGGAIAVNLISFKYILSKPEPLCDTEHYVPTNTIIDKKLVIGSAIFGIGWGILGICPGPGVVNIVTLHPTAIGFIGSMIVGMVLFEKTKKLWG